MKEQKGTGPSLNEIYKLAKENNKMLKNMRRQAFIGNILKIVWWVAILIVIPYFIYVFYLQPYVEQVQELYGTVNESAQKVDQATSEIESFKNSLPDFSNFFGGQN